MPKTVRLMGAKMKIRRRDDEMTQDSEPSGSRSRLQTQDFSLRLQTLSFSHQLLTNRHAHGDATRARGGGDAGAFRGRGRGDVGARRARRARGDRGEIEALGARALKCWTGGRVVLPGFVDAHAHPVFAGNRADEFEKRAGGASYQEIAEAGGGFARP